MKKTIKAPKMNPKEKAAKVKSPLNQIFLFETGFSFSSSTVQIIQVVRVWKDKFFFLKKNKVMI